MTHWEGLNRRKFPRVNYPCLVVVRNQETKEEVFLTHTENVGIGGVCIILEQDLKMFSSVDLELDLLDLANHIKCKGKIVWNVQRKTDDDKKPSFYDIGIEFVGLSKSDDERLQEVVSRLVKED